MSKELEIIDEEIKNICKIIGDGWVITETGAKKVVKNETNDSIDYILVIYRNEELGFYLPNYSTINSYYRTVSRIQNDFYIRNKENLIKLDQLFKKKKLFNKKLVLKNKNI